VLFWPDGEKTPMSLFLLPVKIHLDGMIDDEVSRTNWINLFWVTSEFHHCIPHGSKVHHSRNTAAESVQITAQVRVKR